ncbi:MAG: hypothetical protein DA408_14350 [Bacteroidetes bacterium]|nr:MAG: hypothetical protein DA408_14350 [Bacteroidota bacterium]
MFPFLKRGKVGENILLTGIPRSGTTLACRLLCNFGQTVALNEPLDRQLFGNPRVAQQNIKKQGQIFRTSLLCDGTALARTQAGKLTDNAYSPDTTQRERIVARSAIAFNKPLERDFTLVMKHCAEFTLLLPALAAEFSVYALIRNPLAILASWASVNVPVSRGQVAKSARLNPAFHAALSRQGDDLLQRQLFILSWYFGQYNDFSPNRLLRYEDLVQDPAGVLAPLAQGELSEPFATLQSKNTSALYDKAQLHSRGEALLRSSGHYWRYYSREVVGELLQQMTKDA